MTAVNKTSVSLPCTVHVLLFLLTQIHSAPVVFCVMCLFCVRACCRGRTIFHKARRAPLVHVSKHDTAASVTHLFPLCSPCMSKVCRIGVVLHLNSRPNGAEGISAKGRCFFTRSKSCWSNLIIDSINHTTLSLPQTKGLGC